MSKVLFYVSIYARIFPLFVMSCTCTLTLPALLHLLVHRNAFSGVWVVAVVWSSVSLPPVVTDVAGWVCVSSQWLKIRTRRTCGLSGRLASDPDIHMSSQLSTLCLPALSDGMYTVTSVTYTRQRQIDGERCHASSSTAYLLCGRPRLVRNSLSC